MFASLHDQGLRLRVADAGQLLQLVDGQVGQAVTGVHTRDGLADLAVDELQDLTGMEDAPAKALIMKAREHWFTA